MRCTRFLAVLSVLTVLCLTAAAHAAAPNVLFVLIDDMGYGDLSCYGGTRVQTPNIDRLASEGVRFTQFYVNAPICSPSRVAFTTGQYPNRWRITSYLDKRQMDHDRGIADWLDPTAPTLARALSQAGYYTAHVGKWHMGGQRDVGDAPLITQYGFARSLTSFEGLGERVLPKFEPHPDGRPFHHEPTEMNAQLGRGEIHWVDRQDVTRAFVDRALEEMDNAAKANKPFYINLWPDDVHSPMQSPINDRGNGSQADQYLGVVRELDKQLGRVFDHIRSDEKLRDNTIILLASDNGPERGLGITGGLRGDKGQLYEGGIKEPFIVWAPNLVGGAHGHTNTTTVIAGMDFSPSILAMTNVVPPAAKLDGVDLSPAMLGRSDAPRPSSVMWVRPPDRPGPKNQWPDLAIRDGDWKLLVKRDGSQAELFDIAKDADEKTNVAGDHADVTQKLSKQVIEWDKTIP